MGTYSSQSRCSTAAEQRRFLAFFVTPDGMPRLRFCMPSSTPVPVFFDSVKPDGGKKKSMQESPKEGQQPSKKQPEKDEGNDFANRCIIDMYNFGASRMKGGLYSLG